MWCKYLLINFFILISNMIIVIIFLFFIYLFIIKRTIEETFENKTVISIFSDGFGLGLGDYMRGLIYLHKNCGDCIIYADYSQHKLANYLENINVKPSYNIENIDRIWSVNNLNKDVNYVYCNSEFGKDIDETTRQFLLKSFKLKPEFEKEFNDIYQNLNLDDNFVVLHIRLDDKYFNDKEIPNVKPIEEKLENEIIPKYGNNVLVMSNSLSTKNYFCDKYELKQHKIKPVHTIANTTDEDFKNTLIEFFLISKSKKIYQFSHYLHSSGFSTRISEIYNIELEKIHLQ